MQGTLVRCIGEQVRRVSVSVRFSPARTGIPGSLFQYSCRRGCDSRHAESGCAVNSLLVEPSDRRRVCCIAAKCIHADSVSQHGTALLIFERFSFFHRRETHRRKECRCIYEPWETARAAEIIAEHAQAEGATLPILHALQEAFGYVPAPAMPMIAARAQSVARRGPRRRHLLSRFPPRAGRPPRAEAVPRRGLPGRRRRCAGRACRSAARHRARHDHRRRRA